MIKVICGGKRNEGWVEEVVREYGRRMQKYWQVEWRVVAEEKLHAVLRDIKGVRPYVVLLDERGKMVDSPELASLVGQRIEEGREVWVVIGGAYGFDDDARAAADFVLALSPMVFPHQMCRAIMAEQLYRAQEIYLGRPYHHE